MFAKKLTFCPDTISVYIHWPFCLSKCPYCDFNSYVSVNSIDFSLWQKAYINEIEKQSSYLQGKHIKTIFFGGGTPSLIKPELIESIITTINKFNYGKKILEITLESNPSSIEISKLRDFKYAGINRISLGIQSLNENYLKFLGRTHSVKEAQYALDIANNIFDNVSFDLISGLPNQSLQDWKEELQSALLLVTSHISVYELTIEPHTLFYKLNVPSVKSRLAIQMFNYTLDLLTKSKVYPYEISNYAVPGKECLHNLQYWQGGLYVGIGPGAHGRVIKNNDLHATVCYKSPKKWLEASLNNETVFSEIYTLNKKQRLLELLILNLRLYSSISPIIIKYVNKDVINFLLEKKIITKNSFGYYLTKSARLQLNSVVDCLAKNLQV